MGDFERRSAAAEQDRARKQQAEIDSYRADLSNGKNRRCETCVYWDSSTSHIAHPDRSPCRFSPPSLLANIEVGVWPFTSNDDWCGVHVLDASKVDDLCMEFARELAS